MRPGQKGRRNEIAVVKLVAFADQASHHLKGEKFRRVSVGEIFLFSSRRRHTRFECDWSSDVCSSDLSLSSATVRGLPFISTLYSSWPSFAVPVGKMRFCWFMAFTISTGERPFDCKAAESISTEIGRASCRERV